MDYKRYDVSVEDQLKLKFGEIKWHCLLYHIAMNISREITLRMAICDKGVMWVAEWGGFDFVVAREDEIKQVEEAANNLLGIYRVKVIEPLIELFKEKDIVFMSCDAELDPKTFGIDIESYLGATHVGGLSYLIHGLVWSDNHPIQVSSLPEVIDRIPAHPKQQRKIMREVWEKYTDKKGKLLIYSNSTAIFNEFRIMVKEGIISAQDVGFLHLETNENSVYTYTPSIDQDGQFDLWPRSFFDTFENQLMELL